MKTVFFINICFVWYKMRDKAPLHKNPSLPSTLLHYVYDILTYALYGIK